jgi:hypothetical protein
MGGRIEFVKEDLELIPMVLEFKSFGKTVKMNIFKCESCMKLGEEALKLEDPPKKEEKKDEPEKPLPEAPMKKDNLDRE